MTRRVGVAAALTAVVAAGVLGAVTGEALLPRAASGAPGIGTPAATGAATVDGPVVDRNLLTTATFDAVGLSVREVDQRDVALSACTGETTFAAVAGTAGLHRAWAANHSAPAVEQVAGVDVATAEDVATALLRSQEACQEEPLAHWVYGPTHRTEYGPDRWAAWLGVFGGEVNAEGRAPDGAQPCGGVVVFRNGGHLGLLEVTVCADSRQLGALGKAAVDALA